MGKHTPGPWYLVESATSGVDVVSKASYICAVDTDLKANKANAQLIAASPLMYEALLNLENDNGHVPQRLWQLVVDAVLAAGGPDKSVKFKKGR